MSAAVTVATAALLAADVGETVGWIAGALLGAVLVVAGASKLAAGRRWTAQARQLGVDARLAAAVPWLELVIGAATAVRLAHPWPALAAIVLLAGFTGWLVRNLLAGVAAPCACFGGLSLRPMAWRDVGRNAVLLALAVVAVVA